MKQDGIYKTENGWDIVEDGKTYSYCCEPDGLYLYLDWEGKNQYTLDFKYSDEIYRKTVGHTGNISATTLKFLCKNKDGLKDLFKLISISNTDTLSLMVVFML